MNDDLIKFLVGGERFTELKNDDVVVYRFDKLIFGCFVLVILAFFVAMFLFFGSDRTYHIHYVCDTSSLATYSQPYCENPFYKSHPVCDQMWDGACDQEFVMNGFEFGKPAPFLVKHFGLILGVLLFFAFLINHFVHNKDFRIKKLRWD